MKHLNTNLAITTTRLQKAVKCNDEVYEQKILVFSNNYSMLTYLSCVGIISL